MEKLIDITEANWVIVTSVLELRPAYNSVNNPLANCFVNTSRSPNA